MAARRPAWPALTRSGAAGGWLAGGLAGLTVLGPALAPGSLFLLDASFVPHYPVPSGVWGLGPEIPRRVPLGLILAWLSGPLEGALAAKLFLAGLVMVAFAGAWHLADGLSWPGRLGAGAVYALSPLLLTRLGAGQWNVLAAAAVLPWALPWLLTPGRNPARTFLWAAAMGATGSVGGTLAGVAVLVGLVAERSRAALWGTGLAALAQVPWLVPGIVVVSAGGLHLSASGVFATQAHGLDGILGLLAGHGFWSSASQVGGNAGPGVALLGAVLGAMAILGAPALPRPWRWRAVALAGAGLAIALASALPWTSGLYRALTGTAIGAPFREGERAMALTLVWLAPASAWGAARLAGQRGRLVPVVIVRAAPAVAAVALAVPGLWGVGGRLAPVAIPPEWGRARLAIQRQPGPVLALPFHRHLPLALTGGQDVLNPLPDELGGDVISSPDLEQGTTDVELADPRVPGLVPVLARARGAQPVAHQLARAGVRWVALLHAADWRAYRALSDDPGLAQVTGGASLQLFEVRSWRGPVVDRAGQGMAMSAVLAPLRRLAPSGTAVWEASGSTGWMRGAHPATVSNRGLLLLPAGRGPVWYWPALITLLADLAVLASAVAAWRSLRRPAPV